MIKKYKLFMILMNCIFTLGACQASACMSKKQLFEVLQTYRMDIEQNEQNPVVEDAQEEELHDQLDEVIVSLYQDIVKITALYYFQNLNGKHELSNSLLSEIGVDLKKFVKIFALYVPKLLQNKKLSWSQKIKNLTPAIIIIGIVGMWVKKYVKKPTDLFQTNHSNSTLFFAADYKDA